MKNFYFLSPFTNLIDLAVSTSILGRAEKKEKVKYFFYNLHNYSSNPHKKIDDYPFGGGNGMVMSVEPIFNAIDSIKKNKKNFNPRIIFPTPDGRALNYQKSKKLIDNNNDFIFICGHYKGIDQRIRDVLVTDEISIGNYIVTNGEIPAIVIVDSMVRLIPGVLNNYESVKTDSFFSGLIDEPHYTRPAEYRGLKVPKVLLSGNHENIKNWKLKKKEEKTKLFNNDLWNKYLKNKNVLEKK